MKIIARVLKTGPITKQSEKDQKKGLRFLTVVREEISKAIGDKTYGEFLIYSIKTTDEPEIIEEDKYLIEGNLWEMRDNNQVAIRGFTNPVSVSCIHPRSVFMSEGLTSDIPTLEHRSLSLGDIDNG